MAIFLALTAFLKEKSIRRKMGKRKNMKEIDEKTILLLQKYPVPVYRIN